MTPIVQSQIIIFLIFPDLPLTTQLDTYFSNVNLSAKMACCLQLLVYLKAKDWLTISLFSHRTPQVFFKSCCCHELKTGNKRITNLSFISLHRVDEKNIFTNRKPVTLYLQNKLHENTALVAGSILFFYLSKLLKKISYFLSREANKKVIATVFEGLKLR